MMLSFKFGITSWTNMALSTMLYIPISLNTRRDSFVLKMKISKVSATRMCFEYYIFKLPNKELALEGTSVVVWLDKNLRPTRIPTEAKLKLMSYLDAGCVEESIHVAGSSPI
ncbi:hypothetical protein EJ110_NYTH20168 [Nymphaea thermarum]|nr:hypothetical protein EJ110_NYTH20168 [Nymphaea thermarum]